MTDKPTPGPWRIAGKGTIRAGNGWIANVHWRNREANARLIAQAWTIPQLRAALEKIEGLSPGGPHVSAEAGFKAAFLVICQARDIARAALALANEPADGGGG